MKYMETRTHNSACV